jgi:serine/threonine protein kinase
VLHGKSVVVKTLKPECQDVALAINEIEGELEIHSRLDHPNIVNLIGAGFTPRGVRFVVLERLDGGTLSQLLGYDNRIRDRRRRFWTKKKISYLEVLKTARSMADALAYCHGRAIPNAMVLHRDLKPDNVGFTLDGTVKIIDFGLARIVENATVSNDVYEMSGETGSLRYMSPEVANCQPYNQKADVVSTSMLRCCTFFIY